MTLVKKICLFFFCLLVCHNNMASADMNIAVITPISGDFKYFSEELINGAKVAVDEINENGGLNGKRVNLIQIDDPCDDTLSLTTAQMLAVNRSDDDKMYLVIGPQCENKAEDISSIFAKAEIFQIHPTGSSNILYKNKHKNVIEFVGFSEQQGIDFFRFYADNYADKKLAVVYDSNSLEKTEIAKEIQRHFTKAGMGEKLTAFSMEPSGGDARLLAQAIKASGAEAVFLLGSATITTDAVRYLKTDNEDFIVFVNQYFVGKKFVRKMGEQAEGVYILALPSLNNNPNFAEDLVKLRLWGIEPEGLMTYGYLSVRLWQKLANTVGSFDYTALHNTLNKQVVQTGWGNVMYTDGVPDRSLKYIIYKIENGEYTQVY